MKIEAEEIDAPTPTADAWNLSGAEYNERPQHGAHTSSAELADLTAAFLSKGGQVEQCRIGQSCYGFQRVVEEGKPWGHWGDNHTQCHIKTSQRRYTFMEQTILQLLDGDELPDVARLIRAAGGTRGHVLGILKTLVGKHPNARAVLEREA